jgi:predicted Holliday junction resolvase-like endonuclease
MNIINSIVRLMLLVALLGIIVLQYEHNRMLQQSLELKREEVATLRSTREAFDALRKTMEHRP